MLITTTLEGKIDLFGEDNYYIKLIGFFIGIAILGITCYIDDSKGVPSLVKLAAQVLAAVVVCCMWYKNRGYFYSVYRRESCNQ